MISIIIPFFNEQKNLPILVSNLNKVLKNLKNEAELVLVDDGSVDGGFDDQLTKFKDLKIRLIKHKKRQGKGQALKTGLEKAAGEIIVFMDADLQDDPEDLPKFLEKINQGYDFVNGWRFDRKEGFLIKLYSRLAGWFLKTFLHSPYSDINCGFKAFRRQVIENFVFYSNNFRFFPLAVFYNGFRVTEVKVKNNPRRYGQSKFGSTKIFLGVFDMLTAFFLYRFAERPLHFFGIIGSFFSLIGFLILVYLAYERIFHHLLLYRRPVLWLGILLVIIGIQIAMTGIIGELIVYLNKKR